MQTEKKLERWVQHNLLTEEQAEKIMVFERTTAKGRGAHLILYGFLILGVSVVSIGLVSLIAANWQEISYLVKFCSAFGILAGLATGAYWADSTDRKMLFEVLQSFLCLSCLATIGLIGQAFHSDNQIYHGLTLWLLITFPIAYRSSRLFLPGLWSMTVVTTFFVWLLNGNSIWADMVFQSRGADSLSLLIVCLWLSTLLGVGSFFKRFALFGKSFDFFQILLSVTIIIVTDTMYLMSGDHMDLGETAIWPMAVSLAIGLIGLAIRKNSAAREKVFFGIFLMTTFIMYAPVTINPYLRSYDHEIYGAAYFVFSAAMLALFHAVGQRYRLFHAMTIIIGIRFIFVYFQVFGDLAKTGLGLVLSGAVIMALAAGWFKVRNRVELFVKGVVR